MPDQPKTPTDAEVLSGGPGIESPEPKESPAPVTRKKVKLSGNEYEVDDALSAAIEAREAEFQRKLSEQSEEVGRARDIISKWKPIETKSEVKDEDEELAALMFENPKEAIKRIRQTTVKEVEAKYNADQGQREFWQDFYAAHPELRHAGWVAQQVLTQNFESWRTLSVRASIEKLAVATKEQILALNQEGDEAAPRRTKVEGTGDAPSPKPEKKEDKTAPVPLTTLISRRREARRKAMLHQK
jgi:hypothetical protein